MNQAELDAAIQQANRIFSRRYRADTGPFSEREVPRVPAKQHGWPPESLDAERRFAQPHARLFPFLGRKVRTPAGPGTLLQVFADRATVVLDAEMNKCSFFAPGEIEPANWSL